jgi:hypothetical protein
VHPQRSISLSKGLKGPLSNALLSPVIQSVLIIVSVLHIIGFNKAIKVIACFCARIAREKFAFARLTLMVFYLNLHPILIAAEQYFFFFWHSLQIGAFFLRKISGLYRSGCVCAQVHLY